jgi:hypothetical protein
MGNRLIIYVNLQRSTDEAIQAYRYEVLEIERTIMGGLRHTNASIRSFDLLHRFFFYESSLGLVRKKHCVENLSSVS